MLERFINDRRKLIQIEALKTLYLYDPEKVINFLKEKSKKPNIQMIKILAEIATPEVIDLIISLLEYPEYQIRDKALRNLKHLLKIKKEEFSLDTITEIEQAISKTQI